MAIMRQKYYRELNNRNMQSKLLEKKSQVEKSRIQTAIKKFLQKMRNFSKKRVRFLFFCKKYFQKLNFIQETYLAFDLNVCNKKVRAYYNKKVESA
jgi:hypothetical protein